MLNRWSRIWVREVMPLKAGLDIVVNGLTIGAGGRLLDLASQVAGKGAALVGVEVTEGGPTTVQGAIDAIRTAMADYLTSADLAGYTTAADLVSTALGKGAALVGVDDGTVTGNPATVQAALVGHDTAIAARTVAATLLATTNGDGAALVGVKAGTITGDPATVQAALEALQTRIAALEAA